MKNYEERARELLETGIPQQIKKMFGNSNQIPNMYYLFMADYVDSLDALKDDLSVDPVKIANILPSVVASIREGNIGVYGRTDGNIITMNSNLSLEQRRLYFFHELTHAIQGNCLSNGHNGMFLTEGMTQMTAEVLAAVNMDTDLVRRVQTNTVRGQPGETCYSYLSEYQINGCFVNLLANSMGVTVPQVLACGYNKNGRELLEKMYDGITKEEGSFNKLMDDMEKIYAIDKLLISGYGNQLSGNPVLLQMEDGRQFMGSIQTQKELIDKVQRELCAVFINGRSDKEIVRDSQEFARSLTNENLRRNFMNVVTTIKNDSNTR